jgi:hypothetical protein
LTIAIVTTIGEGLVDAADSPSTRPLAYIECMRPRGVEPARVPKKTGGFYYPCDWHASHYVKVSLTKYVRSTTSSTKVV